MRTEEVTFVSDGVRLNGAFFFPDDEVPNEVKPLVIIMSGFTGLWTIHPARYSRFLTRYGFRCFSFDYRGFAKSEGIKGQLLLEDQVRDVRNAISFARSFEHVDGERIALVGWAMGAGVVLKAAYRFKRIRAICCLNGFFDGWRFSHFHRGDIGMAEFEQRIELGRIEAARTGRWPEADAFDIYPLDPSSSRYVEEHLKKFDSYFDHRFSLAFGDSLLNWKPEALAPFQDVPIWIAHGEDNTLHSPEESKSLWSLYKGERHLYWIKGAGHTEWLLDDNPIFQRVAADMKDWLTAKLI